ncbi:hypothetical protein PCASD_03461 [Puccinia coronata f. sp. avenae]|uniref:Uncharacterized protein n=1 Tax=Puccinia coronata f. sp. avenae TaxID=200324 RepID=A0A2N5V7S1_9BASI|nr:hypothetical protein PCASD_03461 [Puccinia coronata f. sp. avenae]
MFTQTRSPFPASAINPSTLTHPSSISGRSHKLNRKPVFRVFCDDALLESHPSPSVVEPASLKTSKPATAPTVQTVVNNNANQVPELNNRTISASRQHTTRPSSIRSRVSGDKSLADSARVNCLDKWGSTIPFSACHSPSGKLTQPCDDEPIKTDKLMKPFITSRSQSVKETKKKTRTCSDLQPIPTKRLSSHMYCRDNDTTGVDDGLIELVSKLEALQANTTSHDDTPQPMLEILDPLPPNATCPGAPKIPSCFTMPLFVADDAHCDDADDSDTPSYEFKSVHNALQMSPLAEVTEAFTGLQGGWSPPLETLSPILNEHLFDSNAFKVDLS